MKIASMCGHKSLTDGLNKRENHARIEQEILASIEVARNNAIPNLICFSGNRAGPGRCRARSAWSPRGSRRSQARRKRPA